MLALSVSRRNEDLGVILSIINQRLEALFNNLVQRDTAADHIFGPRKLSWKRDLWLAATMLS